VHYACTCTHGLQESKITTHVWLPMHVFRQRSDGTLMIVLDQLIERKINIIPKKKKKCTIENETSHGLPIK
jgi:hypothetical protein